METRPVRSYTRAVNSEALSAAGAKGGAKRHDPRVYAKSIARRWPELTEETRAELRAILAPITGDSNGGRDRG